MKKPIKPLDAPNSIYLQAAEGWLGLGDVASAYDELKEISPKEREHPAVLCVKYEIYAQEQKWDLAVAVAGGLTKILPDESAVWIWFAYATRRKTGGSIREAKEILLGAARKFRGLHIFPYNLACYCAQLGELEEAEQWLKKAIEIDGDAVKKIGREDADLKPLWEKLGGTIWDKE